MGNFRGQTKQGMWVQAKVADENPAFRKPKGSDPNSLCLRVDSYLIQLFLLSEGQEFTPFLFLSQKHSPPFLPQTNVISLYTWRILGSLPECLSFKW